MLAVAQQLDVAPGGLVAGLQPIGEADGDLLGDDPCLLGAGDAAGRPPPSFLPCEGELAVSVFSADRVDPDPAGP